MNIVILSMFFKKNKCCLTELLACFKLNVVVDQRIRNTTPTQNGANVLLH